MSGAALTKAEVNARFYETVGGEILFATEAQGPFHQLALGRLVACQAHTLGKRRLRILEIGANDCAFAAAFVQLVAALRDEGEATIEQLDYTAVEYARRSLEAARRKNAEAGLFDERPAGPEEPSGPATVAVLASERLQAEVRLVNAEACSFARESDERFDVVILNELLDDLPGRAFHSDAAGRTFELDARARPEDPGWVVTVRSEPVDGPTLPPRRLTATSPDSVTLVSRLAGMLEGGGLLVVHDYGIAERHVDVGQYERPPRSLPPFVHLDLPVLGEPFPTAFYRIFGNEAENVLEITTDVNFAELAEALEPSGRVVVLPHGNAMLAGRELDDEYLRKGDGIFLSEFGTLGHLDDLDGLLARLERDQVRLREAFTSAYLDGAGSFFADLVYVKRAVPER